MYPIADMFTIIRNALLIGKDEIIVSTSKLKLAILKILKEKNYISDYKVKNKQNKSNISIILKYQDHKPVITKINCISKPGRRFYSNFRMIPRPLQGLGSVIISTSQGVMDGESARKKHLGGEIICEIY